jgi:hypothetical protein
VTEIRIAADSPLPAERVLAAGYDFSDRRAAVFPAVRLEHFQVHELGEDWADATEARPPGSASTGNAAATTGHSPTPSSQP